jgi:hypothetical protein
VKALPRTIPPVNSFSVFAYSSETLSSGWLVVVPRSRDPDLDTRVAEYFEACYCPTMDGTHTQ